MYNKTYSIKNILYNYGKIVLGVTNLVLEFKIYINHCGNKVLLKKYLFINFT